MYRLRRFFFASDQRKISTALGGAPIAPRLMLAPYLNVFGTVYAGWRPILVPFTQVGALSWYRLRMLRPILIRAPNLRSLAPYLNSAYLYFRFQTPPSTTI